MPIVDYNRIYKVRSRERQPVLYSPHMVPDAAGAYLRASAPGLNARFADAEARAKEKQGNIRAQYQAIGNLIGVGAKVGDAYARAVERRDEADFNALAAAWQNHMNEGADKAWKTPRQSDGNGGWTGPSVAIRELDKAFDGTEAFETARAGVKERFQKWRAEKSRTYFDKADQAQERMADNYQKQSLIDRFNAADAEIKMYLDINDGDKWKTAVDAAVDAKVAVTRWGFEQDGMVLSAEQEAGIRRDLKQNYLVQRGIHLTSIVAAQNTADGGNAELEAAKQIAAGIEDDSVRRQLDATIAKAVNARESNMASFDKELDAKNLELFQNATFGDLESRDYALTILDSAAGEYRTAAGRAAFEARVERARTASDIINLKGAYDALMEENDTSNIAGLRNAMEAFKHHVDAMGDGAAKDFGMKMLAGIGRDISARANAFAEASLVKAEYGYNPTNGEPWTVDELLRDFQENAQYFTAAQAEKYRQSVRKRMETSGADIPSADDLKRAFDALGMDQSKADVVFGEAGLIRYTERGWSVDKQTWDVMDDKRKEKRDGLVDIGGGLSMSKDAVELVLSTMKEYAIAKHLDQGKNAGLFDTYLQRLRTAATHLSNQKIIEESLEARRNFERTLQGAIKAPAAFPWRAPDAPEWDTALPDSDEDEE